MIYVEKIETDDGSVYVERQKNAPNKKWYGLDLVYTDEDGKEVYADNERWITDTALALLKAKDYTSAKVDLNVKDKQYLKKTRKVLLAADALGWFDEYK
jgi:hypothetical protein